MKIDSVKTLKCNSLLVGSIVSDAGHLTVLIALIVFRLNTHESRYEWLFFFMLCWIRFSAIAEDSLYAVSTWCRSWPRLFATRCTVCVTKHNICREYFDLIGFYVWDLALFYFVPVLSHWMSVYLIILSMYACLCCQLLTEKWPLWRVAPNLSVFWH